MKIVNNIENKCIKEFQLILKQKIVPRGTIVFNDVDELQKKVDYYVDLLLKWNNKINLIGKSTINDVYHRHVIDCLQLVNFIASLDITITDLGTGAGLPGLILGFIGFKKVNLIEKSYKKTLFLKEASKSMSNVQIYHSDIEKIDSLDTDIVMARALAPLSKLLDLAIKFNHPKIEYLFLKGEKTHQEIDEAQQIFNFEYNLFPSLTSDKSHIINIRNLYRKVKE